MLRALSLFVAVLLFMAMSHLPIGYYTFLRFVVTLAAILLLAHHWPKERLTIRTVTWGAIAILFNPIIPIYLHSKSVWMAIDLGTGIVFIVSAILHNKRISKTIDTPN